MRYLADLHIHSLFSRATSKASHLRGLAAWAAVKGIDVVATGDFTHPAWFAHLHEELLPAEEGLFRLRPDAGFDYAALLPEGLRPGRHPEEIRFLLSAEISCIYKRGGQVRKVHNLLYAPDMEAVRRINTALGNLGNISADGRPILGLDSRDLLEIVLERAPEAFLVPAHIWTPWFSLFGSKSGFDRLGDCFADLSEHIFALETGLSSDPAMNRMISALDGYTLISNSDCHSPAKLGREANLFETGRDFFSLRAALRAPRDTLGRQRFLATIEFFPEEGKYHNDGHRKCGVCLEPRQSRELGGLCPVCGKGLTVGVLHRVLELADRDEPLFPQGSPAVHSLVPLAEIVAELLGVGVNSRKVMEGYARLITLFASEFELLLDVPLEELRHRNLPLLAEAIDRVRNDEVIRQPGYDGEFGVIRVFSDGERARLSGQRQLFGDLGQVAARRGPRQTPLPAGMKRPASAAAEKGEAPAGGLNPAQEAAVRSKAPVLVVQAGPGTGKTHTLTSRVQRLLAEGEGQCTVITFTNKAADTLRQRLRLQEGQKARCRIATFHGFCLELLRCRRPGLGVVGPEEREAILAGLDPDGSRQQRRHHIQAIANHLLGDDDGDGADRAADAMVRGYLRHLAERDLVDLDDICRQALALLRDSDWGGRIRAMCGTLFVDEFQDVSAVQYALVAALAAGNPVFCIGDPDQAIYGFRGARPERFYRFIEECGAERHSLRQNYRNGAEILEAATAVIRHNPHPLPLPAPEAMAGAPARLHVRACATVHEEARFIADQIEAQTGGLSHRGLERMSDTAASAVSLGDIAVLYRSLRQASALQNIFAERGIPFQQVELEAYYMRGACRLLYDWILLLGGRGTAEQLLALLGREQGVGAVRLAALQPLFARGRAGTENAGVLPWLAVLAETPAGLVPVVFLRLARRLQEAATRLALPELLPELIEALSSHYELERDDAAMERLRQSAVSFSGLDAFAAHLERYSDSVLYDPQAAAVTLSTLHAAKGLEFDVVFLCGCEQDLLPIAPREPLAEPALREHLAEERRLFYVGMTRARRSLYCTWCRRRQGFVGLGPQADATAERQPSPFLSEFSPELVTPAPLIRTGGKKRPAARQLSLFSGDTP